MPFKKKYKTGLKQSKTHLNVVQITSAGGEEHHGVLHFVSVQCDHSIRIKSSMYV